MRDKYKNYINSFIKKINNTLLKIKDDQISDFINEILNAKTVFIYGVGRSGLVAKSFAIRLSHLNIKVCMIGDTITKPVKKGDLLIAVSGSGNTKSVVVVAKSAKKIGCRISIITSNQNSKLFSIADTAIIIEAKTKEDDFQKEYISSQLMEKEKIISPMGTIFEISSFILLDTIIEELIKITKNTEDSMRKRHSNIE